MGVWLRVGGRALVLALAIGPSQETDSSGEGAMACPAECEEPRRVDVVLNKGGVSLVRNVFHCPAQGKIVTKQMETAFERERQSEEVWKTVRLRLSDNFL